MAIGVGSQVIGVFESHDLVTIQSSIQTAGAKVRERLGSRRLEQLVELALLALLVLMSTTRGCLYDLRRRTNPRIPAKPSSNDTAVGSGTIRN